MGRSDGMETVKMIRPVRCVKCGDPMFYSGNERHEPEVRVEYESNSETGGFYIHTRCWNEIFGSAKIFSK